MAKKQSKPKQAPRVQMGRTTRTLPEPTARQTLTARLTTHDRLHEENRLLRLQNAQLERETRDQRHAADCESIALERAAEAKLDALSARKVCNIVENQRRSWVKNSANAGRPFPLYETVREALHRLGASAVPPTQDANPLDAALPPPRAESSGARPLPAGADPEALERKRRADERGKRLREQNEADKRAYQEALRKHGLSDPSHGMRGGNPGGFGY